MLGFYGRDLYGGGIPALTGKSSTVLCDTSLGSDGLNQIATFSRSIYVKNEHPHVFIGSV